MQTLEKTGDLEKSVQVVLGRLGRRQELCYSIKPKSTEDVDWRPSGSVSRQGRRGDHAGSSDEQVQTQPVVGLVRQRVVPERAQAAEAPAAVRAAKRLTGTDRLSMRVSRFMAVPRFG
jgi:hypothetical protein